MVRPPTALWGYNMQVTDEALEQIAQAIRDRDVTIAFLQQRLTDSTARPAEPGQEASPEPPAGLQDQDDHAAAEPGDGALAAEEQSW